MGGLLPSDVIRYFLDYVKILYRRHVFSGSTLKCYDCTAPVGQNLNCELVPENGMKQACTGVMDKCITYIWGGE